MDGLVIMLSRGVYRDELERNIPRVDELMLCSGGYNHDIVGIDVLLLSGDFCVSFAGCEDEDLVDGVDFVTNVASDGNWETSG